MAAEPIIDYTMTDHAVFEIGRRGLKSETIDQVLKNPEQRVDVRRGRVVLQSRIRQGVPDQGLCGCRQDACRGGNSVQDHQDWKVLEGLVMKVRYDRKTDTLSLVLRDNVKVFESDEDKPGVILDYDENGNLISLEILDASKRVTDARKVDFQLAE